MMCVTRCIVAVLLCLLMDTANAATLEQLSLPEMVEHATLIVRARPAASSPSQSNAQSNVVQRGAVVYTLHQLDVVEVLHGEMQGRSVTLALPGGKLGDRSQVFSGVPSPELGAEYIFFLWRGRNGLYQLVGLNQGMLEVSGGAAAKVASRPPIEGTMLSRRTGLPVRDQGLRLSLRHVRAEVAAVARARGELR